MTPDCFNGSLYSGQEPNLSGENTKKQNGFQQAKVSDNNVSYHPISLIYMQNIT